MWLLALLTVNTGLHNYTLLVWRIIMMPLLSPSSAGFLNNLVQSYTRWMADARSSATLRCYLSINSHSHNPTRATPVVGLSRSPSCTCMFQLQLAAVPSAPALSVAVWASFRKVESRKDSSSIKPPFPHSCSITLVFFLHLHSSLHRFSRTFFLLSLLNTSNSPWNLPLHLL